MKKMTVICTLLAAAVFAIFLARSSQDARAGDKQAATIAKSPAAGCIACHKGSRSFAGRDSAQLAKEIRTLIDDEIAHPPLKLDDTSNDALLELAKKLTAE